MSTIHVSLATEGAEGTEKNQSIISLCPPCLCGKRLFFAGVACSYG